MPNGYASALSLHSRCLAQGMRPIKALCFSGQVAPQVHEA